MVRVIPRFGEAWSVVGATFRTIGLAAAEVTGAEVAGAGAEVVGGGAAVVVGAVVVVLGGTAVVEGVGELQPARKDIETKTRINMRLANKMPDRRFFMINLLLFLIFKFDQKLFPR